MAHRRVVTAFNSPDPGNPAADPFHQAATVPAERRHASRRPRIPVARLLVGLVLAILLPTLGLGVAATWCAVADQRAAAEARLEDTARDIALALDRDITGYTDAMIAFAASPAFGPGAAAPDLPALHAQAQRIARLLNLRVGVARPDGSRVLHSAEPLGTPLPPLRSLPLMR